MDKRKIALIISDIVQKQTRGDWWITLLQTYFNPQKILLYTGMIKILLPVNFGFVHIPEISSSTLIIGATLFFLFKNVIIYIIGHWDKNNGIQKKQAEYLNKDEDLAPWQCEVKNTMESICKAVGAKSKFKDL